MAAVGLIAKASSENLNYIEKIKGGDMEESTEDTEAQKKDNEKKKQLLERSSWWITTIKETPPPGTYNVPDFLQDAHFNPVQKSYNFKGPGRKVKLSTAGSGEMLLPGCYNFLDLASLTSKLPQTYSFKNSSRQVIHLGIKDKEIDTDPCQYNVVARPQEPLPCKHSMFRSGVRRFPTIYFAPKEGPGPGEYNLKADVSRGISSCFKSNVPRLQSSYSKTPGPGTYDPM